MPSVDGYDDQGNVGYSGSSDAVNDPLGVGFGPAWRRWMLAGLYNGDFSNLPPDLTETLDSVNNPLPYWNGPVVTSGTSITAQVVALPGTGSGYGLQWTVAAGAAGDSAYIEQIVPISSSNDRSRAFYPDGFMQASVTSADVEVWMEEQFLQNDGVTTTGTAIVVYNSLSTAIPEIAISRSGNLNLTAPADAYYMRVRVGVRRRSGGAASAVAVGTITEVYVIPGSQEVVFADLAVPGTYGPGVVEQAAGAIYLRPDFANVSGTAPGSLVWNGTSLTFPNANAISNSAAGTIRSTADLNTGSGTMTGTLSIAGTPTDANFLGTAANGGMVVSTAGKFWCRTGAATWKGVAIAGLSVPREERRCPRCLRLLHIGDELVPVVNELYEDRARHALYNHRRCGWRWRLARRLGLARDHTGWYTAAIRRVEGRKMARASAPAPA